MTSGTRALLWAMVLAAVLGLAAGWLVRTFTSPTVEEKAFERLDELRERTRRTH